MGCFAFKTLPMEVKKVDDISFTTIVQEFYQPGIPVNYDYIWHSSYAITPSISEAFNHLDNTKNKCFVWDAWSFKKKEITVKTDVKTGNALLAK